MDSVDSPLVRSSLQPLSQVDRLKLWRQDALMQHHYQTAEYIGDKILALTDDSSDAFWLAQVYYANGSYARAKELLVSRNEVNGNLRCQYLAALCLAKMSKWDEALEIIGETTTEASTVAASSYKSQGINSANIHDGDIKIEASISYLRGQIYTSQNNFDRAKECYQEAVRIDVKCYEAFEQLIRNNLLSPQEEWKFLQLLDFQSCCGDNAELVKSLYSIRLGKYTNLAGYVEAEQVLKDDYGLANNADVLLSRADMLFVQCRFKECLKICEQILEKNKFKFTALPNYLACLHELGSRNKLFLLAHDMVDNHPNESVSWLAVGIYYLTIGKIAEARRFFSKASMMNPYFAQAWIGFAHTFAVEGEHEQAISAYSTAARLFQGTHLPTLFLGMQHLHLNNLNLAEEYLSSSYSICKTDPLLLNEMGVVHYHKNDLKTAETYFHEALKAASSLDSDPKAWLSIQANLGHVYRRLDQYDRSLSYFEEILRMSSRDSNIHSAMGLLNLQAGRTFQAIENFHDALSITPNDPIASDLLTRALEEHSRISVDISDVDEFDINDHEISDIIQRTDQLAPSSSLVDREEEVEVPDDSYMEMESD
jgi:anaphase-promoting complex subunit 6